MKKQNDQQWGPDDALGRLIGQTPYPEQPPGFERRVMAQLEPIAPGRMRRLWGWINAPMMIRISPVMAGLLLLITLMPAGYGSYLAFRSLSEIAPQSETAHGVPVVFYYKQKDVNSVALMGSFNNWDPKGNELQWRPELGQWALRIHLAPGKYDYVFLVNGDQVFHDPNADVVHTDDFGNRNSVVFIKGNNGLSM